MANMVFMKVYDDMEETIKLLSDEAAGRLFKAMFAYHRRGETLELDAPEMIAFSMIRQQFERDSDRYNATCEKNRRNGSLGGRPKKPNETQVNPTKPTETQNNPTVFSETEKSQDKEEDKDKDKEEEKKSNSRSAPAKHPTIEEVRAYCDERHNGVDADKWMAYYESNGWRVGRNPMKDWKAAVRTWERNGYGRQQDDVNRRTPQTDYRRPGEVYV